MSLFFLLLNARPRGEAGGLDTAEKRRLLDHPVGWWGSVGLALALGLSVFLRVVGLGLDYSLIRVGGWVGWGLGLCLGWMLMHLDFDSAPATTQKKSGVTASILGFLLVLTLVWFSFSAPSVIARWTEGNYTLIVILISLFAARVGFALAAPPGVDGPPQPACALLLWNVLFTLSLTAATPGAPRRVPARRRFAARHRDLPRLASQIPLLLTLLLFPVLFLDLRLFLDRIRLAAPAARRPCPWDLLGGLRASSCSSSPTSSPTCGATWNRSARCFGISLLASVFCCRRAYHLAGLART